MDYITKIYTFNTDSEGIVDGGNSNWVNVLYSAIEGNPVGSLFADFPFYISTSETASKPAYDTWESWGVPPGKVVKKVQLEQYDCRYLPGVVFPGDNVDLVLTFSILNDKGYPVHAGDLYTHSFGTGGIQWATLGGGFPRTVIEDSQPSDTKIRFLIQYQKTSAIGWALSLHLDNIRIRVEYEDPPAPPPPDPDPDPKPDPEPDPEVLLPGPCPDPEGKEGRLLDGLYYYAVEDEADRAVLALYNQRLFVSIGKFTYCYDLMSGGWSDTAWGLTAGYCPITYPGHKDGMFLLTDPDGYTIPTAANKLKNLSFTSPLMEHLSPRRLIWSKHDRSWQKYFKTRGIDGYQHAQRVRRKRAKRLTVWGYYHRTIPRFNPPNPDHQDMPRIGWVKLENESGYYEVYPIHPNFLSGYENEPPAQIYEEAVLCRQEFTPNMVGRVFQATIFIEMDCVLIHDLLLEYTIL